MMLRKALPESRRRYIFDVQGFDEFRGAALPATDAFGKPGYDSLDLIGDGCFEGLSLSALKARKSV